jgi:DNA-binding protein HU-beta
MNKRELVDAVAASSGIARKDASAAVDAVFDTISDTLKNRDKVAISGFGTFEARYVAAREARNPQTGASVTVAARYSPKFKAGKALKDTVA